ncbi:MAG TPA: hypothetical protein VGJ30_20365 [Candidatus Angelobacter sp.]
MRSDQYKPRTRALRVYAFDPSRQSKLDRHLIVRVPYEILKKGPSGELVEVVDYDACNRCYYPGINLDDDVIAGQLGHRPSESDPEFHQQMVYAIVMDTIRRFESALGRKIKWRNAENGQNAKGRPARKLRIFPHAMQEANAFYDPRRHALLFGYFTAAEGESGVNLPGQTIFTCLSQDIIIHETTHAILDNIRDHFDEPTGPDAAAFHEGFADIIALLQHFSFRATLLDTIQRTGGGIHRSSLTPDIIAVKDGPIIQAEVAEDNPMVELARQFGEAIGNRRALRHALGTAPNPELLKRSFEPHERGGILVAAIFDAFFSVYVQRTRDLFRIAYPDGRSVVPNFLHNDLAVRLADAAAKTAARLQNICIRALDYCPPVDITFGDYLRALITSDRAVLEDDLGFRTALIRSFRARGIQPEGVRSYAEEEIAWKQVEDKKYPSQRWIWGYLNRYEEEFTKKYLKEFRERMERIAYLVKEDLGFPGAPIDLGPWNTIHRVMPDGSLQPQIIAQFLQSREETVDLDGVKLPFTFRGGTTLIFDREGCIQYSIAKSIGNQSRLEAQKQYLTQRAYGFPLAPYADFDPSRDTSFRAIHRGY